MADTSKSLRKRRDTSEIRDWLLAKISDGPTDVVRPAMRKFGVTRQAINAHLRALVSSGKVEAVGSTQSRRYRLRTLKWEATKFVTRDLKEDVLWEKEVRPLLKDLPENVRSICMYGFTEIVNNVVDHSGGTSTHIQVESDALFTRITVADDGVGIFKHVKDALGLEDERYVILELAKGKLTTDPERHSGEGIFFSSRAFDRFSILSGRLFFNHDVEAGDWQLEDAKAINGTRVSMSVANSATRTMQELYDRFASTDDRYKFSVTHVPVKLAQVGQDNLISRSQGKRLVSRFERFERVLLDFTDVGEIGQAFADEVFRVFQLAHPGVTITYTGASSQVEHMITRALSALNESVGGPPSASS